MIGKKELPDGRCLFVFPLIYGGARLGIGENKDVHWNMDEW